MKKPKYRTIVTRIVVNNPAVISASICSEITNVIGNIITVIIIITINPIINCLIIVSFFPKHF